MEKLLGNIVCRKWRYFKAAGQAKGERAGVWFPFLLHVACRADWPLPTSRRWRRMGCASVCPDLKDAQGPLARVRCLLDLPLCWAASWPPGANQDQVSHPLAWLSHRNGFHWKPVISVSNFYFAGGKHEGFVAKWEDHRRTGWGFVMRLKMTDTWMLHIQIKKLSKEWVKKNPTYRFAQSGQQEWPDLVLSAIICHGINGWLNHHHPAKTSEVLLPGASSHLFSRDVVKKHEEIKTGESRIKTQLLVASYFELITTICLWFS